MEFIVPILIAMALALAVYCFLIAPRKWMSKYSDGIYDPKRKLYARAYERSKEGK